MILALLLALSPGAPAYTTVKTKPAYIRMYWKDHGNIIGTFGKVESLHPSTFVMNGGMFSKDRIPLGLYIEDGVKLHDVRFYNNPNVNFGMQPQAVFFIANDNKAGVCRLSDFKDDGIRYATQSAPLLVVDGEINPNLPHSKSVYRRNGVGILKDGSVLLAISEEGVTFQQFAKFFKDSGCISAMYLDGGVSHSSLDISKRHSKGKYSTFIAVVK